MAEANNSNPSDKFNLEATAHEKSQVNQIAQIRAETVNFFNTAQPTDKPFPAPPLPNYYLDKVDRRSIDCYHLPQSTVVHFVGREKQLAIIETFLQREDARPLIITGMTGVGKSELALQYAWQHREKYPGGTIWIDCRQEDIARRLVVFALSCKLPVPDYMDVHQQLRYCCQQWNEAQKPMLFVLDDLDKYNQVFCLLPILPSCVRILITTRQYFGSSVQYQYISLDDALDAESALALLGSVMDADRLVKRIEDKKERTSAEKLCALLEYLPLALELVGRYLDLDPDLSIGFLYERMQRNILTNSAFATANSAMRFGYTMMKAFDLSWERLPEDARRLGCFVALFASSSLSWSLVREASVVQPLIAPEARSRLLGLNLLRKTQDDIYRMHSLLQEFFRMKLDDLGCGEPLKLTLLAMLASHALKMPEHPSLQQIVAFEKVYSHIRQAIPALFPYVADDDIHPLFAGVCHFYQGQGKYQEALDWLTPYLSLAQDRLGSIHPCIVKIYRSAGCLSFFMHHFDDAERYFQNAIVLGKEVVTVDSLEMARIQISLAALYREWGRFDDAERYAQQALTARKAAFEADHLVIAESLMTLGTIYFAKGRSIISAEEKQSLLLEAEKLFLLADDLRQRFSQPDNPDIGENWNNLGVLYEHMGKMQKAEEFHLKALAFNERVHNPVHPLTASSYNNLGKVYLLRKHYTKALEYFAEAEKVFAELDLPESGWCRHNMALVYEAQGKQSDAQESVTQACQIIKERYKLPDTHPFVTRCAETYARIYGDM